MSLLDFFIAMNIALGLGLLIGLERQFGQHPAGMRTSALVCGGAALYVLVARPFHSGAETARIAGQVVSGMGFLGGGVILREGLTVRGLTSAATIWCTAAVGTLCGAGLLTEAALAAVAILLTNRVLNPLSRWVDRHAVQQAATEANYRLKVICMMAEETRIRRMLAQRIAAQQNLILRGIGIQSTDHADRGLVVADVEMRIGDEHFLQDVVAELNADASTVSTSWERQS
jgi:putative Mg2+ transporter-C (MgtC) family protein